jgi:hypothetical protein
MTVDKEQRRRRATIAAIAPLAARHPDLPPSIAGLEDAAEALDALAAGMAPDRARVIAGALALDAFRWTTPSRDLLDAAAGLRIIATGGTLDLDEAGRARARQLAEAVRREGAP